MSNLHIKYIKHTSAQLVSHKEDNTRRRRKKEEEEKKEQYRIHRVCSYRFDTTANLHDSGRQQSLEKKRIDIKWDFWMDEADVMRK